MTSVAFLRGLVRRRLGSRRILLCLACRTAPAISAAWGLLAMVLALLARRGACRRGRCRLVDPRNGLADQAFNGMDCFTVNRSDNRDCRPGTPGPAGTTDAVHIVVGVMRHIEIEHMTHFGN